LEAVFSVLSMPRLYKEEQLPLRKSFETAVRRVGGRCETAASLRGHEAGSRGSSESESESLYDWRFTANQFVLATSYLRLTTTNIFQLNTCGYSPYVTTSLARGWVCHLQLLLVLASAVILRSDSTTGRR
jgi:hypothetical protein